MSDGSVRSSRVLIGDVPRPATVFFEDGVVTAVGDHDDAPSDVVDHGDLVIMPALVDTHVHVNEPGRTEWEGFATATAAARAGGVAVIVDMPLNSVPATTTTGALDAKRATARGHAVDVGFWGGIVPGNLDEVPGLAQRGVFGFKSFLVESGVEEFECIELGDLHDALAAVATVDLPLIVHAEAPGPLAEAPSPGADYASYLASRPSEAEVAAIEAVIDAARDTGGRAHILHLSAADALPLLEEARRDGIAITVETCPHYLAISADQIPDAGYQFKCAPPIRDADNRDRLWDGLLGGIIDMVVSDHSPAPPEMKAGGFDRAWGGIASLELRLPVVWTEASARGISLSTVSRWLSAAPAELIGLETGRIEPGFRADLVVWDPDDDFVVDPTALAQRHPVTPYAGRTLRGRVVETIVRGGSTPTLLPKTP